MSDLGVFMPPKDPTYGELYPNTLEFSFCPKILLEAPDPNRLLLLPLLPLLSLESSNEKLGGLAPVLAGVAKGLCYLLENELLLPPNELF